MTMHTLARLSCAVITLAACSAHAADKQMPIDFVGEWCSPEKDGNSTQYSLPSWALEEPDGKCTNILSVEKWGFNGFGDLTCFPAEIKTKSDTAPSGTAYFATIKASCTTVDAKGQTKQAGQKVFEFERYKGHLTIKTK